MDIIINIVAKLIIVITAIVISWLSYGLYATVAHSTFPYQDKDKWIRFYFYLGIILAFIFGLWIIFGWLMPMWDCYWNNICLN